MRPGKILLLALIASLIAAFFLLDLGHYLNLEYFKSQQALIETYREAHPWSASALFFGLYVLVTALSLPGAAIMTLAGGAIFGLVWGVLLIVVAAAIGATLAFLSARYLLRNAVHNRFGRRLSAVESGIKKDGAFYLLFLRLVPVFPFFVINLLMGLTPIRVTTYFLVSLIGMVPATIVYANAGTQLAQLKSLSGILSPNVIGAFVLLGIFPLLAKKLVEMLKTQRVYRGWKKPRHFDRNLIVIGAGSAGLVAAYIAAAVKAKVTLIEKHRMGGDCLNTGCVPSKSLIRASRLMHEIREAETLGIRAESPQVDFAAVMARVQAVVHSIEPHDSVERYTKLGVECLAGDARLISPWEVQIGGSRLSARNIVIATGAEPFVPPLPGLDTVRHLTSDNVWELKALPQRMIVLGGGPIGCELAQCFARLGTQVTVVEFADQLLPKEDREIAAMLEKRFEQEGIITRLEHRALSVENRDGQQYLVCETRSTEIRIPFDEILIAVGRSARIKGYGLEDLGIEVNKTIQTNAFLQTRFPNIYACGDVAGPFQFTHTASHQAWYASVNALFSPLKKFKADYSVIPWVTFTAPEIARVGLSEKEAGEENIAHEITRFDIGELDRAIIDGQREGVIKVLTVPGKDRILGCTIVSDHAAELLPEFILAMRHGIGLNKLLSTIHVYPTFSEANKMLAGQWKREHAPQFALKMLERFHAWRLR